VSWAASMKTAADSPSFLLIKSLTAVQTRCKLLIATRRCDQLAGFEGRAGAHAGWATASPRRRCGLQQSTPPCPGSASI